MSIYSMLYNGLSGINSMSGSMGVASDNVANVNTPSYKSSRMNFADLISLSQAEIGQVGTGSQTGDITKDYKPGQMERTDRSTDLAITGNGFFMLRDEGLTDTFYTRDGQFRAAEITGDANAPHKLVNNEGYFVQGINTGSMENPTGTIEDIVVLNKSLPKATESTMAAFNLENDPLLTEAVESSLFANWDGTNLVNGVPAPINPDDYSYSNIMKIYDDTPEKSEYEMTIYFDQTTQDNEQEFLVTCEPDLDRRLIGNTGLRYNDGGTTTNKGAGALLYGKLSFNPQGELDNISCWNVPPDGNLNPTPANQIDLARGEGFYSFDFNMSGVGENLISTLNFGTEPSPQTLSSPGAAIVDYGADTQDILLYENTDWSRVYDADGNKAQNGDIINFTGNTGEGTAVSFNYTVDFNNTMADLLTSLSSEFNCKASIERGGLTLADNEIGDSQLNISSISYTGQAELFGAQGDMFNVIPQNRAHPGAISTTNYATSSTTIYQTQDGYGMGFLDDVHVGNDGKVTGYYSNGQAIEQAQLMLADFVNYDGLRAASGNNFLVTDEAGDITVAAPGEEGLGGIAANSLEMSNVDLARQFVELITTQRGFQANSTTLKTADEIFQTTLQMV